MVWRAYRKRGIHARHRHGLWAKMREFIWPSIGIVAFFRWMGLRLLRQTHKPHYVALGAAIGIMVAFWPIVGTHTALLLVLCSLLGGSFVAAFLTSMLANPWTIGPMWAASFHVGRKFLGMTPGSDRAVEHLNHMSWFELWQKLEGVVTHIIFPTVVGGLVIGGPVAFAVYLLVYWQLRVRRGKKRA
jgi:uncharacterized protein (DUF2062 family)